MPYKCVFRTCKGNYEGGPKVSMFSFPRDENLLQKWLAAIPRNFKPNKHSKVCELHFKPSDIITTSDFYSRTGKTITAPLLSPRLTPGAVPSPIPRSPKTGHKIITSKCANPRLEVKKKSVDFKTKSFNMSYSILKNGSSGMLSSKHKKSQLVTKVKESSVQNENAEKPSQYKAPEILYINDISKDTNVRPTSEIAQQKQDSSQNVKTTFLPAKSQLSEMTVLCGPFPTIEAAASMLYGTNAGTYKLGCGELEPSSSNSVVIKVEPSDSLEELSENSSSVETESLCVGDISISHLRGSACDFTEFNQNIEVNSRNNSQATKTGLEEESTESDDLNFFKSLIPDFKHLSRAKKSYIRLKIQELIYKEVYSCNKP